MRLCENCAFRPKVNFSIVFAFHKVALAILEQHDAISCIRWAGRTHIDAVVMRAANHISSVFPGQAGCYNVKPGHNCEQQSVSAKSGGLCWLRSERETPGSSE